MKSFIFNIVTIFSLVTACMMTESCIYDAPGDKFFRTLWKSTPSPLMPYLSEEIKIEFLCDEQVAIQDSRGVILAYGTYNFDDSNAIFSDLSINVDDIQIIFMEAHRDKDKLFLLWRSEFMTDPYTTTFIRLSSYE